MSDDEFDPAHVAQPGGGWCAPSNIMCGCGATVDEQGAHTCQPYTITWKAGPCDLCGGNGRMMDMFGADRVCVDCNGTGKQEAGRATIDPSVDFALSQVDLPQISVVRGGIRFPEVGSPE